MIDNTESLKNDEKLKYFYQKLLKQREEILSDTRKKLENLKKESQNLDSNDAFMIEKNWITECSLLNKEKKMLDAIDRALMRIKDQTYGYCEETGDPIELARLEAYPTATLCIEAQQEKEKYEKIHYSP